MPLLALLKHPLVGGEGDERLAWLEARPRRSTSSCAGHGRQPGLPGSMRGSRQKEANASWRACPRAAGRRSTGCSREPLAAR